eukprot:gene12289-biopygen8594
MLCMTRPPTVLVLVVVAVLLACGVPAASAAGGGGGRRMCGHAALMQRRKATAAAEPVSQLVRPAAQPVGTPAASGISYEATYDNIRIGFFTKDLEDASRYCAAEGQVVKDLVRGGDYTCRAEDVLTESKRQILLDQLLPAAIMLHQERLKVQRLLGFVKMSDLEMTSTTCSAFTIPESHQSKGVYGYDVVFYVSAAPTSENIMAVADACYKMSNGRPCLPRWTCLRAGSSTATTPSESWRTRWPMPWFSLGVFTSKGMTKTVADVRGKPTTLEVVSAKAVKAAQEHFGDSSLTELEDPLWDVHWNGRNLKDELMASNPEVGAYTAITLDCSRTLGTTRRTTARRRRWLGGTRLARSF